MRKPPAMGAAPPPAPKQDSNLIVLERDYELITPLYGGGVKAGKVDSYTPIRGTSIRGQLRFWWRAIRGGLFGGSLEKMWALESQIWGAASASGRNQPSSVSLSVQTTRSGEAKRPFTIGTKDNGKETAVPNEEVAPAYVSFSIKPTDEEIEKGKLPAEIWKGIAFTLTLCFEEKWREDVEAALWAWETFGGIGARTRRGFGAIRCLEVRENKTRLNVSRPTQLVPRTVREWIIEQIAAHQKLAGSEVTLAWPKYVPHLSPSMRFKVVRAGNTSAEIKSLDAWKKIVSELQAFRQSRDGRFGPSEWPEPNAIRQLVLNAVSDKSPYIGEKFPRAHFGLPIIFHFPKEPALPDMSLQGKTSDRMASALIIRPLWYGGLDAVALAIILQGPQLPENETKLILKEVKNDDTQYDVQADIKKGGEDIEPLNGNENVLEAFIDSLRE